MQKPACTILPLCCMPCGAHPFSAMQVCFSEGGERFAAIGQGGLAAAWRLDAPQFTRSDSGPLARSDWCHQVP